ncbi:Ornithine carbamoyltransferase [Candidatus Burarchaeum australiense]|nr:Ornithine carbamoyltransferase [Candidatus Burarchaeum australiense]
MAKKDLLGVKGMEAKELKELLKLTAAMKKEVGQRRRTAVPPLQGKTLGMIFERPSTRTRVSFEVAMTQLGGHAIYLDLGGSQLGRGESMADTARALSQFVDAVLARVYKHEEVEELARYGSIPVINGMSDREHPCQALGDVFTMQEKGRKSVAIVGDPQTSVANSLLVACAKLGIKVHIVCPPGYMPREEYLREAEKAGADVRMSHDVNEGVREAEAIYVATWKPGGAEEEGDEKMRAFLPFQVNSAVLARAKKNCIVMHPLPARRGVEITSEVLDSRNSVVWEQTANRLHVQKAILAYLLGKK